MIQNKIDKHMNENDQNETIWKENSVSRFCHSQGGVYITQIKVSSKFVERFRSNYSKPIGCVFPKSILPVSALFYEPDLALGNKWW